ncbi:MAG TPA: SRPBCC family protein [bacterium]|nr:SRPBCC family protein [bacterium]
MLLIVGIAPGGLGAEPLSADEGRLLRGDVLISFREAPETSVHEVQGEILTDAPPELIWSALTDYAAYQKIFPSIAGSELLDRKQNIVHVKIRINNLWPYPDFVYTLKAAENKKAWTISFTMEEGNLKTEYESIALHPFAPDHQKTRVVYVLARDPGWFVPKFSSDLDNRSIVIERLLAIRKEVRTRKKKLEPGANGTDIKPQWRKALFWWEKGDDAPADNKQPPAKEEKPAPSTNNPPPPKHK